MKLPGIGPAKLSALNENQIFELEDLLNYFPSKYTLVKTVERLEANKTNYVNCQIVANSRLVFRGKLNYYFVTLKAPFGEIKLAIFNQPFLLKNFKVGDQVTATIKVSGDKVNLIKMTKGFTAIPYIEVKYSAIGPVKDKDFKRIINFALENTQEVKNDIPEEILTKRNILSKTQMYKSLHQPKSMQDLKLAKITYLYSLFYKLQTQIQPKKQKLKITNYFAKIEKVLPYPLTQSQNGAIETIQVKIVDGEKRLLVHGDVGSGKTIIGFINAINFSLNKFQTVFASPTTLLAKQHYQNFIEQFPKFKDRTVYYSAKSKNRKEIEARITSEENLIVFGTHVALSSKNKYNNLGLLIIDEQQRFGVAQRNQLERNGLIQLMLTATPIPKTFADLLYRNVSLIKIERFRKPQIMTKVVKSNSKIIQQAIKQTLDQNQKIYAISSRIDSDENLTDLKQIQADLQKLDSRITPELLSSNNTEDEKEAIMEQFKNSDTNCLIATSLIEVGIDVESATLIIIYDAHRFGLSQLHQLRGRVGRNELNNICLLIANNSDQLENERLRALEETNDGFKLSQMDYIQRGPGELLGQKQSGNSLLGDFDFDIQEKILDAVNQDTKEKNENSS
jgi:ATP-dependent DNA helicase RecG